MVNFAHMSVIVLSVLQFGIFHFQFQFFIGIRIPYDAFSLLNGLLFSPIFSRAIIIVASIVLLWFIILILNPIGSGFGSLSCGKGSHNITLFLVILIYRNMTLIFFFHANHLCPLNIQYLQIIQITNE